MMKQVMYFVGLVITIGILFALTAGCITQCNDRETCDPDWTPPLGYTTKPLPVTTRTTIITPNESTFMCCYNGVCAPLMKDTICNPYNMSGKTTTTTQITTIPIPPKGYKTCCYGATCKQLKDEVFCDKYNITGEKPVVVTTPSTATPRTTIIWINDRESWPGNTTPKTCCYTNICKYILNETICDKDNATAEWDVYVGK